MSLFRNCSIFLTAALFCLQAQAGDLNPFDDDPSTTPRVYSCPADNGATYTTNEVTFELKCDHGTTARRLRNEQQPSQTACADTCAKEPLCQSCDWGIDSHNCGLFLEYIPTIDMKTVNTWFPTKKRPDPPGSCPDNNGKTYTAPDGTYFRIACGVCNAASANSANIISSSNQPSLQRCMDLCAQTDGCFAVDLASRAGGKAIGTCDLYKVGGGETTPCASGGADTAYTVDPPVEDQPDEGTIACSTTCPFANGQVYSSRFGETFRMNCGRRHGTRVIYQDKQASFKDCMDACAALVPCHSVDYHESKKTCYYGQHHGEPTKVEPGF